MGIDCKISVVHGKGSMGRCRALFRFVKSVTGLTRTLTGFGTKMRPAPSFWLINLSDDTHLFQFIKHLVYLLLKEGKLTRLSWFCTVPPSHEEYSHSTVSVIGSCLSLLSKCHRKTPAILLCTFPALVLLFSPGHSCLSVFERLLKCVALS